MLSTHLYLGLSSGLCPFGALTNYQLAVSLPLFVLHTLLLSSSL
jgi:hypothetical protein